MPIATDKMSIQIEDGFTPVAATALTQDTANPKRFSAAPGTRFSLCGQDENKVDRRPVIRPNGVRTGFFITPASGNDAVALEKGTAFQSFLAVSVNAVPSLAVPRGASTDICIINSVTLNGAGAVTMVAGTAAPAYSAVRGAAGGPPLIPVDSIEIGQVRLNSITAAPVTADEIVFSPEYSHAPEFRLAELEGAVEFLAAPAPIHTGNVFRKVYAKYSIPVMVETADAISKIKPVNVPKKIADLLTYGGQKSAIVAGNRKDGSFEFAMSADAGNIFNRIDNTVRLFRLLPDSTANRAILFYSLVSVDEDYAPGNIPVGKATLQGITDPVIEIL